MQRDMPRKPFGIKFDITGTGLTTAVSVLVWQNCLLMSGSHKKMLWRHRDVMTVNCSSFTFILHFCYGNKLADYRGNQCQGTFSSLWDQDRILTKAHQPLGWPNNATMAWRQPKIFYRYMLSTVHLTDAGFFASCKGVSFHYGERSCFPWMDPDPI